MVKVYLASPLFNIGERIFNEAIVHNLHVMNILKGDGTDELVVYSPQENGKINDKKSNIAGSEQIFELDTKELLSSDVVLANIDGIEIDAGVSAELGIAYANNIPIVALYSDIRALDNVSEDQKEFMNNVKENLNMYKNLYVIGLIKKNGVIINIADERKEISDVYDKLIEYGGKK